MRRMLTGLAIGAAMAAGLAAVGADAGTLDRVRQRGHVVCSVDQTPGFGDFDTRGQPIGFEVDLCRAVATAVLKDPNAIQIQRVTTKYKFRALAEGELDIALGMTTWTFDREAAQGVLFPLVTFYDGQGFMAWNDVVEATALKAGTTICVQAGTTSAGNLADLLTRTGSTAKVLALSSSEEKLNAFAERRCDVVTGDRSELAAQKSRRAATRNSWKMLAPTISREPLGPAVANGDVEWFNIVRWAMAVPMIAEARGVTSHGLDQMPASDTELRRLKGEDPTFGSGLHLDPAWARRIVTEIGNYDEIFQRNLAPLNIGRELNGLWSQGGLLYPPPLK